MNAEKANHIMVEHLKTHYPLKQLKIDIQGDRYTSREQMISRLHLLVSDLESGCNEGESWLQLDGYRFQYQGQTEEPIDEVGRLYRNRLKKNPSECSNVPESFSDRLSKSIGSRSARSLASDTGISDVILRKYIRGESTPNVEQLVAIANSLGVSVEWLATGKEN